MAADAEVSDLVLRVLLARRQALRQGGGARTLEILGSQLSPATHTLLTWASRKNCRTPGSTSTTPRARRSGTRLASGSRTCRR
jgi:hypothetical protein